MLSRFQSIGLLIAVFAILRFVASFCLGLGGDEVYYVLYSRNLALSYFDHPPLVGWFQALFHYPLTAVFGFHDWIARVPASLLFAGATYLSYRLIFLVSKSKKAALLSALTLNSSVLLNVLGLMLLPDCFLLVTAPLLIFTLLALDRDPARWRNWLFLGLVLGFSGLAKYTAFLFLIPTLWFLGTRGHLQLRTFPKLISVGMLGLFLVSPVLIWNGQHDWISFRYQGDHVVGAGVPLSWKGFFLSIGRQFLAYGPPLFVLSFYGLYRAFRSDQLALRLASWIGLTLVVFFGASALYKTSLPHWTSPYFALFIPIGFHFLIVDLQARAEAQKPSKGIRRVALGTLYFSLITVALVYLQVIFKPYHFRDFESPFRDVGDYPELMRRVNEELGRNPNGRKVIGLTNWSLASRVIYYNLPYSTEVKVFDSRVDQFAFWNPKDYRGSDVLFLVNFFLPRDIRRYYSCKETIALGNVDLHYGGSVVDRYYLVWCKEMQ